MRVGLRSLQACILLASAAVAAFADTPSGAAGSGAVQEALAPAGQAGEKTVQEAVVPAGKTGQATALAPAKRPPATPAHLRAVNALAPVKRPPAAPSVVNPPPDAFFTIVPCRVFDTRLPADAPALQTGVARTIQVTGNCGIPTSAKLVAANATVTQQTAAGSIELYPGDGTPTGLQLNDFLATGTRANNAVAPLALNGNGTLDVLLTAAAGQSAHFILDLNGYFAVVNPIAVDDSYNTTLNTALAQPAPGVLANDTLNGGAIFSYGATTGSEQTTIGAATPTSAAGSITLNADGSFNYTPATGFQGSDTFKYVLKNTFGSSTATVTITVGKGSQTITFTSTAPAGATVGGPTYNVTATASSGLTVAFTIDAAAASVCSISGSTVSFTAAGMCVIDANQAGDSNYNPAPQVQQSFTVGKGSQTITFTSTAPVGATVGGPTYNVTATASSGLTVAFTIDAAAASVCSISGSTVSFIGAGTCIIDANQAGDSNYNPAPQAQQSFAVGQGSQTITFTSTAPSSAQVGGPTYNVTATASSGLTVAFTIDASAASVCSISGSTVSFIGNGTCVIDANQAGNANYNPAPQAQQSFGVGKGDQTITFTSTAPAGAKVGGPTYTVTATASSGLTVTFTIDATAASVCSISGSTVSFTAVGNCVIDANQTGDTNYNPAPQVQQSFAVAKGDQTITFTSTAPAGAKVGGPTYTVTATSSSGLTVAFTIDATASSVCSISGSTVSFIGTGTCVIDANQAGNANYNAAPQVQQSFAVAKGDQTITFTSTAPAGAKVAGPTYTVTATSSSGLTVTFTIDASASSVCSISGSTVSFIGVGTCVIDANQAGNANYNAAPQAQQSFAVAKGDQTITYTSTAPANAKFGGPTYTVTATASSGLTVTFTIDASASAVCSISGSTVSFIGAGTCVIDANQAGNANYNSAPQAQQSFAVAKADQTISFTSTAPTMATPGGPTYTVTATATSGLTVAFTIDASATSFCSISGSTVSFTADGTCVIDANQAGNANYNAAPQVQQSFVVDTPPTVTSTSPANNATSVPLASTISITFSKAVTVTGSAFGLTCSPGTAPSFTVTPASPATTYVLHPTANLPFDSVCIATVAAAQVTDAASRNMTSNYGFSFSTPPIANNDTYPETLIGNVSINSSLIAFSVTANDQHNSTITITAFDATSANGGTVAMTTSGAGIGQFTYNPKAGYKGADSFTYTITDANGSSTATVSFTLNGIIWFIDASAGAGDGRLSSPFNSLAAFQAVNDGAGLHPAANANIFLYDNASAYTGPVVLLTGQKLIGQDATSSLSAITGLTPGTSSATLPSTGGGSPNKVSITATGNDVTLGSGNTVWGMTLGNATAGIALDGTSVGALKLRDLTINTTGAAVSLASGALDAILNAVSSGGGTHGISLTSTTGSFDVEGGGASDPANTTKGRTTAKNGGGTLTLGSGGTIQNATSAGVLLSTATNVTLRNMTIENNGGSGINTGGDGITATNGSALTLDNDLIQGQTGNNGVHATGVAGVAFQHTEVTNNGSASGTAGTHVWDVRIDNGTGTSSAANSLFHNSLENIFGVSQTGSATMTLNVTNSQFSDTATTASGNVGLLINLQNTSNVTLSADSSTFLRNRAVGVEYLGNDSSSGSFTVTNSTCDQNASGIGMAHQGLGQTATFNITGNTLNQTGGLSTAIAVNLGTSSNATTVMQGKIQNNTIGTNSVVHSGSSQGSGIGVTAGGAGTLTTTVSGNSVFQVDNEGLNAVAAQGTGTLNLTVTNNHFSLDNASPNSDFGAMVVDGGTPSDSQTLCLNMSGNTDTGNASSGGTGVALLTEAGTPTFNIQGYGGSANNASAIASFIDGANTDSPTPALISPGAGTMKAAPAPCPTPP